MTKDWIRQRKHDPYYRKARVEGYRSRAAYKLKEINGRLHLIRKGSRVLDIGACPGGWSQVANETVGSGGKVVAVDLSPMGSLEGVEFIQGDIEDPLVQEKVLKHCIEYDVVISDASPRLSGNRTLDRGRSLALSWVVLTIAARVLRKGGSVLIKTFQGSEVEELIEEFGGKYNSVDRIKPRSSLKRSNEIYIAFRGLKDDRQIDSGALQLP
ncbi:MAG: RlmE family RNA methyltransferase [Candidatus Thermoplasmatota archaeon]|nr:RlmE family RNA methyltransferase [Candidatus Thermoplasmatota archaeon]